jgi:uncharacterized protein (TIGR02145 family)
MPKLLFVNLLTHKMNVLKTIDFKVLLRLVGLLFFLVLISCEKDSSKSSVPSTPSNPSPYNTATGVSLSPNLTWTCSDPDSDPLTYDVYFDTTSNPTTVVVSNQSASTLGRSGLSNSIKYYWKVVAKDNHNNSTSSPIWHFTTQPQTGTVTDIEGKVYKTVIIGTQEWMAEDLKTTQYTDHTAIPLVSGNSNWEALTDTSKAYCWYADDIISKATYGALYTWAAAMNGSAGSAANPSGIQGVCPSGWHLPSDAEWTELENSLIAKGYNWDGSTTGNKIAKALASASDWEVSLNAGDVGNTDFPEKRNVTGFTALPGGYRLVNGIFYTAGSYGLWWSATETYTTVAWGRVMFFDNSSVSTNELSKEEGVSVRCLRD